MTNIGEYRSYSHFTEVDQLFANDFLPKFIKTTNEQSQFSIMLFIKFRPEINAISSSLILFSWLDLLCPGFPRR